MPEIGIGSEAALIAETWAELQQLTNETNLILSKVRIDKKKKDQQGKKENDNKNKQSKTNELSSTLGNIKKSSKKKTRNLMSLSLNGEEFTKTRDMFNDARVTVEVLDDASPDTTPRADDVVRATNARIKSVKEEQARLRGLKSTEDVIRKQSFYTEKSRVQTKADIFISKPGISAEDVSKEKDRLNKIEESARLKRMTYDAEVESRREFYAQDTSVTKLQSLFRGHVGRQKFTLTKRLKEMTEDAACDWIEVRDRETGDVWYYNKITKVSQWDRPDEMFSKLAKENQLKTLPNISNGKTTIDTTANITKDRNVTFSMTLPSLDATMRSTKNLPGLSSNKSTELDSDTRQLREAEAKVTKELSQALGDSKLISTENLFAPDGTVKPQLRTTVLDVLLETRFDTVSTLLADSRWMEGDPVGDTLVKNELKIATNERVDKSRKSMVSVLTFNKKKHQNKKQLENKDSLEELQEEKRWKASQNMKTTDLTLNSIEHPGFEQSLEQSTMCFGCWSAGLGKNCALHASGEPLKPSQTMLLCRNWELGVMRRRYRAEELQEVFLKRAAALTFDPKSKSFSLKTELKHQIYRFADNHLNTFNSRMQMYVHAKHWLDSFAEAVRQSKTRSPQMQDQARMMRLKRTLFASAGVTSYKKEVVNRLPVPPITGSSWPERIKALQVLFREHDEGYGGIVELIKIFPLPLYKFLFLPRQYHLECPRTIPMPKPEYADEDKKSALPNNHYIPEYSPAGWFEKLCFSCVRVCVNAAQEQITAMTPVPGLELIRRVKTPTPCSIKFATLGRKRTPGLMAIGGLPMELMIYQLIMTYVPPQYGNFMVMDKGSVSPGVTPEATIQFQSLVKPPVNNTYLDRPIEHPLNYRHAPTITVCSHIGPEDSHFYGKNRPDQTGEQQPYGFRTSTWSQHLEIFLDTDPQAFTPSNEIVSLNCPGSNLSVTTHADHTYPFCEPSTRENSTLDFFHLLLAGAMSQAKAQIFTILSVQEPGLFMKDSRMDLPMGHLVVSVYRSWAFTQFDTIQEFKTDDGVSYWYHRRTGQTFWERPLYDEEEPSPLNGGTILDMVHPEEPLNVHSGAEGATRRYDQGQFRKNQLTHHENELEAEQRRKSAANSAKNARERGIFPDPKTDPNISYSEALSQLRKGELGLAKDFGYNQVIEGGEAIKKLKEKEGEDDHSVDVSLAVTADGTIDKPLGPLGGPFGGNGRGYPPTDGDFRERPASATETIGTHHSTESSMKNDQGKRMSQSSPQRQEQIKHQNQARNRLGSQLEDDDVQSVLSEQSNLDAATNANTRSNQNITNANSIQSYRNPDVTNLSAAAADAGVAGIDGSMIATLTKSISQMMESVVKEASTPQEMISLGMGMGMALMSTGAVEGIMNKSIEGQRPPPKVTVQQSEKGGNIDGVFFPAISEDDYQKLEQERAAQNNVSRISSSKAPVKSDIPEPIAVPNANTIFAANKILDHQEESLQVSSFEGLAEKPLTAIEKARQVQVVNVYPTVTPDIAEKKELTYYIPGTAEEAVKEKVPVLIYPELGTALDGELPKESNQHEAAGVGISYVLQGQEKDQYIVKGTENLRRTVMPLPTGFFQAIVAKHIATQTVDYLPQVPNIPQARTVGRVKPRNAAADWLAVSFDPWSAGKNPLNTEFVPSLSSKADKLFAGKNAIESLEAINQMREVSLKDAYVTVVDETGLAAAKQETTKSQIIARDFAKICSLCRHGKYQEAEQFLNQPECTVPIDYQNEQGNTLLHIVCQNGNKQLVKLCLRRGANLNIQNLTGQTPLHFTYGYGYAEVGDYLISKGADDTIKNQDGLTCYEGLGGRELSLL